ncbi:MAG TPA: hypothetical protein GXX25_14910 [Desulfotomaculum sp.]|nr:hypothetical protein [Desulfotomaculum sp.]
MLFALMFITGIFLGFWAGRLWPAAGGGAEGAGNGGNVEVKVIEQLLKLLPVLRASLEESARATEEGVLKAAGAVGEVTARVRQGLAAMETLLKTQQEGRGQRKEAFFRVFQSLEEGLGLLQGRMGASEEMFKAILDLEQKAWDEKIFGILSELEEISARTRMVALNAAIEAARVGEMGRGFAVVAKEVQRLAGQAEKAVQSVSQFGHSLLQGIRDRISGMENSAAALKSVADELKNSQREARELVAMHRQWDEAAAGDAARITAELKTIDRHLDEGITAFQFQDAVAQQISHVRDILLRVEELLSGGGAGEEIDRVDILKELEKMYSMESERSVHRRVLQPDAGAGEGGGTTGNVEFF